MFTIDFAVFCLIYVGAGLALVFTLWIYYDRRDRRYYDDSRIKSSFHCTRCEHLYSDRSRREVSSCPQCGFENAKLKF